MFEDRREECQLPRHSDGCAGGLKGRLRVQGSLNDLDQWKFSHDTGMRVIYMEEFYEMGVKSVIDEIRRVAGDAPTYLTFDVDGLDPVYAAGTGTPEVGSRICSLVVSTSLHIPITRL